MIRMPGARPRRVADVVRLTDIMPTVLELLGLSRQATDGVSLARVVKGESLSRDLESYSESLYPLRFGWSGIYALRDSRFKFIDAPTPELYDLATDPLELHNIVHERPAVAAAMRRRVRAIAASNSSAPTLSGEVSPDIRERLAALGYVAVGPIEPASSSRRLPDPKDCIAPGSICRP